MDSVGVKDRTKEVDVKNDLERSLIKEISLPTSWAVLSYVDNIEYCIKQLRKYLHEYPGTEGVIGFYLVNGWGTKEMFHRILPRERAEEVKKDKELGFHYYTLGDLLTEKRAYKEGKYKVRDGHFVGLNPNNSE